MTQRSKLCTYAVGLFLSMASSAMVYAQDYYLGGAFGVGGADVPIFSYASGYRGTLRLYGGYEFNPNVALEVTTLDLGTPKDKPAGSNLDSTIGGIGVAGVGTLHAGRWRFSGGLGLMSMEGRAANTSSERSTHAMLRLGAGFDVTPKVTLGLETGVTQVKFGAPVNSTVDVHWSALTFAYRF